MPTSTRFLPILTPSELSLRLAVIWDRREMVWTLVMRDLNARYRSSTLGFLWSLLNPLLMMGVYTFAFQFAMRVRWDDSRPYALFLLVGLLPWNWFVSSLGEGSTSILSGGQMVKNIRFPAEVLPLAAVLSNLVHFGIGMIFLFAFLPLGGIYPSLLWLYLPLLLVVQFVFTLGLTVLIAGLTVFFRDIQQLLGNVLLIWFFLSPVIYTKDMIARLPETVSLLWNANPMMPIIMGYQQVLFYGSAPDLAGLGAAGAVGVLMFLIGFGAFERMRDFLAEGI